MERKLLGMVGLLAMFVMLTAEDCILNTTQTELPVRDDETFLFSTQGNAEHSGSTTVDFRGTLDQLEEDNEFIALLRAVVEAGFWRVEENSGEPDLIIGGEVTVTRLDPGGGQPPVTESLIEYRDVPIASVMGMFHQAPLQEAGIDLLTEGFDVYLQARAQDQPLPDLEYRFDWMGSAYPASDPDDPDPDVDFTWEGKIKFTLVGLVEVDVPDPWD